MSVHAFIVSRGWGSVKGFCKDFWNKIKKNENCLNTQKIGKFNLQKGCVLGKKKGLLQNANLSVSLSLDSSPSRRASGEERKLCVMPRPRLSGEVAMRSIDGEVKYNL